MDLPLIDAHTVLASAGADKTWRALVALFAGNAFTNERFAGLRPPCDRETILATHRRVR